MLQMFLESIGTGWGSGQRHWVVLLVNQAKVCQNPVGADDHPLVWLLKGLEQAKSSQKSYGGSCDRK